MGVADWLDKAYRGVVNTVEAGISNLKAGFNYVSEKIKDTVGGVYDDVKVSISTVYSDVRGGISSVGQAATNVVKSGVDFVTNPFIWLIGGVIAVSALPVILGR